MDKVPDEVITALERNGVNLSNAQVESWKYMPLPGGAVRVKVKFIDQGKSSSEVESVTDVLHGPDLNGN